MIDFMQEKWTALKTYLLAPFEWIVWFFTEYIPTQVFALLDSIGDVLNDLTLSLNPASIGVDLGVVNAFFPLPEFFGYCSFIVGLLAVVQLVKWIMKLIPTIG